MEERNKCIECGGHVSKFICRCSDNDASSTLNKETNSIPQLDSQTAQDKLVILMKLMSELYVYKLKVTGFRTQVQDLERYAIALMSKTVSESVTTLIGIDKEIDQVLKILELHQKSDTEIGREVVNKFNHDQSLKAVLSNYQENLLVNDQDLTLELRNFIYIGNSVPLSKLQTLKSNYDELTSIREEIIEEKNIQIIQLKESYDLACQKLQTYKDQIISLESPRSIKTEISSPEATIPFEVTSPVMMTESDYPDISFINTRARSGHFTIPPRNSISRHSIMSMSHTIDQDALNPSELIYIAKKDSKMLLRYNASKNSLRQINLSNYMTDNFEGTSTCILPYGDVFIAGGRAPYRSEAFIYGVNTGECIQLDDMNDARAWISLFYHGDYMYAFGGFRIPGAINKAEKYDLLRNKWEKLPDMNEKRCCFSCVLIKDRIYLMSGIPGAGVEYYDLVQNTFRVVEGMNLIAQSTISAQIDEKLYILDSNNCWIYDKNTLNRLKSKEKCWKNTLYSFSNIVILKDRVFFYNYVSSKIEMFNISKLERKIVKKLD